MGITRRKLFKGALAAALVLVPSLPGLPKVAQEERIAGPELLFNGSHMKLDNYGISSMSVRSRMVELRGETDYELELSSQLASAQARTLDAKIMAMLDGGGA